MLTNISVGCNANIKHFGSCSDIQCSLEELHCSYKCELFSESQNSYESNSYVHVKLKDRKHSMSRKNNHNALWHYRNSHNVKFHVVAVFKQPRRGLGYVG